MVMTDVLRVKEWVDEMAQLIANNEDPAAHYYSYFAQEPELIVVMIELLSKLADEDTDQERAYYSACIFAFDVCVSQLQSAQENGNKYAARFIQQVMQLLADTIRLSQHGLMFWLPVLNAFYDVHAELSPSLKDAYLELVNREEDDAVGDKVAHLNSIRDLIHELSELTLFDMAENFFAQSYAMPPDFFSDLVLDLYSIREGEEVGLLSLLHPDYEVRDTVVATLDMLMPQIQLSSSALSRLESIKNWYPPSYHDQFTRWIKLQRKKGVVFSHPKPADFVSIKASEIDGGGAQGIFMHLKHGRVHRLCGLLFKQGVGIKDAWITPPMKAGQVAEYHAAVFDESVMLRDVDLEYLTEMTQHFLALTVEHHSVPDLHLLEIQEETGLNFMPKRLDLSELMSLLSIQIIPFTPDIIQAALEHSKKWFKTKRFTESWFLENARVDTLVNQCCSYVDGVRVCRFEEATALVFKEEMEAHRDRWIFHFLWVALWLKSKSRVNETAWQDSFLIAYAIQDGYPLFDIPIMRDIGHQSVVNSIETMQDRRTHLN
jgi:hypothetical protein